MENAGKVLCSVRRLLLVAMLVPVAMAQGQCEPLPLPYTTDLLTGFQPPSEEPTGFEYPWREGQYSDNCWTGYLDFGGDPPYAYPLDANSARGRFGFNIYVDGQAWPNYAEMAVKDSTHHGVAMLIAPVFVTAPAAIRVHVPLSGCTGGWKGISIPPPLTRRGVKRSATGAVWRWDG